MKKTLIYLGILLAFIASTVVLFKCNHRTKVTLKEVKQYMNPDSTTYWRDKYKIEHAVATDMIVNSNAANILFKGKIDSLKDRLHLKEKQIKDILETTISVTGSVATAIDTVIVYDTINGKETLSLKYIFNYSDSIINMTGTIDSQVHINYVLDNIPLNFTGYWKRKWFLGKKHYFIDAYSDHSNVHIKRLMKISMDRK